MNERIRLLMAKDTVLLRQERSQWIIQFPLISLILIPLLMLFLRQNNAMLILLYLCVGASSLVGSTVSRLWLVDSSSGGLLRHMLPITGRDYVTARYLTALKLTVIQSLYYGLLTHFALSLWGILFPSQELTPLLRMATATLFPLMGLTVFLFLPFMLLYRGKEQHLLMITSGLRVAISTGVAINVYFTATQGTPSQLMRLMGWLLVAAVITTGVGLAVCLKKVP